MEQGELFVMLALHLLLTGAPGVAAAAFAARRGERREPVLLAVFLVGSGAAAMLVFWGYYGAHELGQTVAYFLLFGSVLLTVWSVWDGDTGLGLLRPLAVPLALWALGSAFLLYLGFLHGGTEAPLAMSSTRFSGPLPSDNDIPRYFADWFFHNDHAKPVPEFPGEWLSSDRPPLQMGYALYDRTFAWDDTGLHYQVMGIVLQQLWIVGVWALLVAGRAGSLTRGLTMLTVLLSNVGIVHSFFVWPKLLPAAMLLAAAALVLTPLWDEIRRSLWGAALFAALIGLAMLGHGASVFGAIPLILIAAVRGLPSWRWIGVAALVGVVVMAPWSAYQKYGDPPGNRLTKWMVGGAIDVDGRGTLETIFDSYEEEGVGGMIDAKVDNFFTIAGGELAWNGLDLAVSEAADGNEEAFVSNLRTVFFLFLLPSLGPLLLAFGAIAVGWRRTKSSLEEWRLGLACLLAFAIGAVAWALLLFGGTKASSVIHQGSLAIPILGLCATALVLRASFPRFAVWFLAANAALVLALYVPSLEPLEGTSYEPLAGVLAALFLAGFCLVALRDALPRRQGCAVPPSGSD